MPVFVEDFKLALRKGRRRGLSRRGALRNAHRRHADDVSELQFRFCLRAAFAHPDFARPNDAIDMTFGHPARKTHEEVVEPLTVRILADLDVAHPIRRERTHL